MDQQPQTLATILHALRPLFPPVLIDGSGWQLLLQLAAELPAETAKHMGFEFYLDNPVPAADFCVAIRPNEAVAQHFIRRGEAAAPQSTAAALAWLIAQLGKADSSLSQWANLAGLEYDLVDALGTPAGRWPEPGVFLRLRRESEQSTARALAREHLATAFATAAGWPEDPQEHRMVERVFDALPPKARLMNAGALPGRHPRGIRLVVFIRPANVPDFLERLKWPGNISAVEEILLAMRDVCPSFALSLDVVADTISPRLGVEMFAEGVWLRTTRRSWRPIIVRLQERGWCSADKAEGLMAWPGKQLIYFNQCLFTAYKGINHCKIAIHGDSMQTKAYTGMTYFPLKSSRDVPQTPLPT